MVDNSAEDTALWLARNVNLWCWLAAILGFGQRYVNADNRRLR